MANKTIVTVADKSVEITQIYECMHPFIKKHSEITANISEMLLRFISDDGVYAEDENLSRELIDNARNSVKLHDIGMAFMPNSILSKKGLLVPNDCEILRNHVQYGEQLLKRIAMQSQPEDEQMWHTAAETAIGHHERWDGKGYPYGKKGNQIPLLTRICTIADAYASIVNERPYREALPHQYAVMEILRGAGHQFDPVLAEVFINNQDEIQQCFCCRQN